MTRRILIPIGIVGAAVLATGVALAADAGHRPWTTIFRTDYVAVHKVCDRGRAVYVAEAVGLYRGGGHGISVVDNAPECPDAR